MSCDGVCPVDTPREAIACRGGEHFVFLRVVKVRRVQSLGLFPERCLSQLSGAECLERAQIVLQPRDKSGALQSSSRGEGGDEVTHQTLVDPDIIPRILLSSA